MGTAISQGASGLLYICPQPTDLTCRIQGRSLGLICVHLLEPCVFSASLLSLGVCPQTALCGEQGRAPCCIRHGGEDMASGESLSSYMTVASRHGALLLTFSLECCSCQLIHSRARALPGTPGSSLFPPQLLHEASIPFFFPQLSVL